MLKSSWMALLTIGSLCSTAGFADGVQSSKAEDEPTAVETLSLETLLAESEYPTRWRLPQPTEATAYSDNWPQTIADIDFQDGGVLSRVSKVRALSLLTLAEFGRSRMFLGVNEDGVAGLHIDAYSLKGNNRYLEVVRMPYLRKTSPPEE